MLVPVLIGPFGDISFEIKHAKWACPFRKGIHVCGRTHGAASIYGKYGFGLPIVTPGIKTPIVGLGGVLPFPFMRETFASSFRIRSSILDLNPVHGLLVPRFLL